MPSNVSEKMYYLPYLIVLSLLLLSFLAEYFLARHKSRVPGLVIPAAFFLLSIIVILQNLTWGVAPWQTGVDVIVFALVCNIPTFLTFALYLAVRSVRRRQRRRGLDRMTIQDL